MLDAYTSSILVSSGRSHLGITDFPVRPETMEHANTTLTVQLCAGEPRLLYMYGREHMYLTEENVIELRQRCDDFLTIQENNRNKTSLARKARLEQILTELEADPELNSMLLCRVRF